MLTKPMFPQELSSRIWPVPALAMHTQNAKSRMPSQLRHVGEKGFPMGQKEHSVKDRPPLICLLTCSMKRAPAQHTPPGRDPSQEEQGSAGNASYA